MWSTLARLYKTNIKASSHLTELAQNVVTQFFLVYCSALGVLKSLYLFVHHLYILRLNFRSNGFLSKEWLFLGNTYSGGGTGEGKTEV